MDEVDYSNYSLDELHQALDSIDKSKYPGNYARLIEEINKKKDSAPAKKPEDRSFFSREIDPFGYVILAGFYLISLFEYSQGVIYVSSRTQKGMYLRGTNATLAFTGINLLVVGSILYWIIQKKNLKSNPIVTNIFWLTVVSGLLLFVTGIFRQMFK